MAFKMEAINRGKEKKLAGKAQRHCENGEKQGMGTLASLYAAGRGSSTH